MADGGQLYLLRDLDALANAWQRLEQALDALPAPEPGLADGLFRSWSWVGSWARQVANAAPLYVYEYRRPGDGQVRALGIFSLVQIRRRGFISSRVFSLHNLPVKPGSLFVEYNGLLVAEADRAAAWQTLLTLLQQSSAPVWDELLLDGIAEADWQLLRQQCAGLQPLLSPLLRQQFTPWKAALFTDDGQPLKWETLLARFSRNRRWQLRRSFRAYEQSGPLELRQAASVDEALAWFAAMAEPHTRHWQRLGQAGSFADPFWVSFHRELIGQAFAAGHIQLLSVTAGSEPLGYVYNLAWRDTVYVLQTGFYYDLADNSKRPGYVAHSLAMLAAAANGYRYYDFMVGDAEYKQVLAGRQPALVWGVLQRPRWRFRLENALVSGVRRWRKR